MDSLFSVYIWGGMHPKVVARRGGRGGHGDQFLWLTIDYAYYNVLSNLRR